MSVQRWPAWLYNATGQSRLIQTPKDEELAGLEWFFRWEQVFRPPPPVASSDEDEAIANADGAAPFHQPDSATPPDEGEPDEAPTPVADETSKGPKTLKPKTAKPKPSAE